MIITLADAKTYIGVDVTDYDTEITAFIDSAGKAFEAYTGRKIMQTTVTIVCDGIGSRYLYLPSPAESITTIHIDPDRDFDADTLIDADDYYLHLTASGDGLQIEYDDNVFTLGRRNIQVVYSAGFATIPDDIQQAAKIQVAREYSEWQRAKKGLDVLESQTVDGWNQKWLSKVGVDTAAALILDRYKSWAI